MRRLRHLFLLLLLLTPLPVLAEEPPAAEIDAQVEQFLNLASAYQSAYLQVVAVSCFQLYASTGIIATDFDQGHIDAALALNALNQNSLLHSVCTTTLIEIGELTSEDDEAAHAEITRLLNVLSAEGLLISTLADMFGEPSEANAEAVAAARQIAEQELQRYTSGAGAPGESRAE